ncbi:tail fiber assembly protein [Desulfovibrio ferrophilus]|uniref:Phage tail assembly chaperone-like domain-containing protein n=1 Tax=Desulfovibrio ferrophilus TaxID=241368 RepID=A0A2Z6B269_9BACT|nr:phage tail assembly chaperone [Desulfovibrio ferrophilus]BBD09602.1 uncharacterized protein DFE_2876 [Desulfovibrio ferrophilus]
MDIHSYHPETGEYLSTDTPPIDPLETEQAGQPVYLLPEGATETAPPETNEGFVPVWTDNGWEIMEDHRGETHYRTATGEALTIEDLGPLPQGLTDSAAQDYEVWDEVSRNWTLDVDAWALAVRSERNFRLGACDATTLPDYPHADDAARQAWLDYRQALRDLPMQQGFPWMPEEVNWPHNPFMA